VDRIPEERLSALCVVGENEPVTLQFLIEDYLAHQRWHFNQLKASSPPVQVVSTDRRSQKSPARSRAFLLALLAAASVLPLLFG
jgi:hypothetical protein